MDKAKVLDLMLSHSCSNPDYPDESISVVEYDLCCALARLKFRRLSDGTHEVLSAEIQ